MTLLTSLYLVLDLAYTQSRNIEKLGGACVYADTRVRRPHEVRYYARAMIARAEHG